MCKLTLTPTIIHKLMPAPPDGFTYEVEQVSSLMHRVWIVNHGTFSYTDESPRSVWGFIKSTGKVYAPKNKDKPRREVVCHLQEVADTMRYSSIIPIPGMISTE